MNIRKLFEKEKEDHYKPVRIVIVCSKNYIEYESNGDRSKTLSTEEHLYTIKPYLKHVQNDLKESDTWKQ